MKEKFITLRTKKRIAFLLVVVIATTVISASNMTPIYANEIDEAKKNSGFSLAEMGSTMSTMVPENNQKSGDDSGLLNSHENIYYTSKDLNLSLEQVDRATKNNALEIISVWSDFSEDRAWVTFEFDNEGYFGLIDSSGYLVKAIPSSDILLDDYDGKLVFTPFINGSCVAYYLSRSYKITYFCVFNTDGEIIFTNKTFADNNTSYHFLCYGDGNYLLEKKVNYYGNYSYFIVLVDKFGRKISDEFNVGEDLCYNISGTNYLGHGIYINTVIKCFINTNTNTLISTDTDLGYINYNKQTFDNTGLTFFDTYLYGQDDDTYYDSYESNMFIHIDDLDNNETFRRKMLKEIELCENGMSNEYNIDYETLGEGLHFEKHENYLDIY